jgi:asparagine N-glycosylation enzyme membrane subunit Stt3
VSDSTPKPFLGVLLVVVAATAIRLWPAGDVLGGDRVRLIGGGDAEYHVLRAQQMAADWPRVLWVDPYLDHPHGALIPWPPLLDQVVATLAVLTGSGRDADHVAGVAAMFPLFLAAATAMLLVALARILAGGAGVTAAFIASMLPASVAYGFIGLADQHALELLLWCAAVLAYALGSRTGGGTPAVALGVVLALSFWNWPGSGAYLLFLSAHAAATHVIEPAGPESARRHARTLALGGAVAALVLAISVAVLAPSGSLRRLGIVSIGGLAVVLCAGAALGAGTLLLAHVRRRSRAGLSRRIAEVAAAGALAGGALLLVPGALDGVRHGLAAAGAANGWYQTIGEFRPALGSGIVPLSHEIAQLVAFYGLALLALPFVFVALRREWKDRPDRRDVIFLLAAWCLASLVAAFARMRFMLYLSAPLGICCAVWIERLAKRWRWRGSAGVAAGALVVVAPAYLLFAKPELASDPRLVAAATWVASSTPPAAQPAAVLASWTDGHALRAAGLPVVSSPFGTDVSVDSLRDEATLFSSLSGDDAYAVAHRRGIGFVMVREPVDSVYSVQDFRAGAGGAPPVIASRSWRDGAHLEPGPDFHRTVMARLFYGDGMASKRHPEPALGWARLVREELPPEPSGAPDVRQIKTFGIVPGALVRVTGVAPGARVSASARISTNPGRSFSWSTHALANGEGEAFMRVPYASGENGASRAGPYAITDGARSLSATVTDDQVTAGAEIVVDLSDGSSRVPALTAAPGDRR